MNSRNIGIRLSRLLILMTALLMTASLAQAVQKTEWSYSQTNCSCDPDGCDTWEWDIHCKVTEGVAGEPRSFETAVEILPNGTAPTVTITDLAGNPVMVGGEILAFVPAADLAAKALAANGLAYSGNEWFGFRSNIELPSFAGSAEDTFLVAYHFGDPVAAFGAGWFSDDGDERYGYEVLDAYVVFGDPVPAEISTWGDIKSQY